MSFPTEKETIDYFDNLFSSYRLEKIIRQYCIESGVQLSKIREDNRKQELVYHRYCISKIAADKGYTRYEIANALHKGHTSITHLLNNYTPPNKFSK